MHGYSTDSDERRIVPLLLASLAISLAWVSSKLLLMIHLSVPWWVDAPSVMAFYGALYTLFDRYLWRNGLVSKMGLVRIPNLAGRWNGYLTSSFDGHAKRHDLMINIFQSWTQITVFFTTAESISRSCVAVIQVDDPEGVALTYQYQNQPLADATRTMHSKRRLWAVWKRFLKVGMMTLVDTEVSVHEGIGGHFEADTK